MSDVQLKMVLDCIQVLGGMSCVAFLTWVMFSGRNRK